MTKASTGEGDVSLAPSNPSRRKALKVLGAATTVAAGSACGVTTPEWVEGFFQQHYKKMTPEEMTSTIARLEKNYKKRLGVEVKIDNSPPLPGVLYGYALNISKCRGYRDCVKACAKENNTSLDPEINYIRVLELDRGALNLETANHYYDGEDVPVEGKVYLPIACQQCDNPPCVKSCPVAATWREDDGIVVIDYDWCIGCRACEAACPYWARHFNWAEPTLDIKNLQTETHMLGNRPRPKGVMEKCTFCIQRTRKGRLPACQEACPTGARVFGNLLDPTSELRYILENKTVFRLKEELNTEPKFWYYTD